MDLMILKTWIATIGVLLLSPRYCATLEEYCFSETFSPQCAENEVIMITEANFGRMGIGRCNEHDFGFLGCTANVLPEMDAACSGKANCNYQVIDLKHNKPCPTGLEHYLEIEYTCVKVLLPSSMCTKGSIHYLDQMEGYISSHVVQNTGCGLKDSPLVINVLPGQRVNFSLINFAHSELKSKHTCTPIGYIIESGHMNNYTICDKKDKTTHLYTSNGHQIRLNFLQNNKRQSEFLVQYEVFGCADLDVPAGMWYKRQSDVVTVGCEGQDISWRLECKDNMWSGAMGNCTQEDVRAAEVSSGIFEESDDLTLLVMVVIGGFFLILIVICVTLIILKCRRSISNPQSSTLLHNTFNDPMAAVNAGHYRSLIKYQTAAGQNTLQTQTIPRQGFVHDNLESEQQFATMNASSMPYPTPANQIYTGGHPDNQERKSEYYAPNYFILDQDYLNKDSQ